MRTLLISFIVFGTACSSYRSYVHPLARIEIISISPLESETGAEITFEIVNDGGEEFVYEAESEFHILPNHYRWSWFGWRTTSSICGTGMKPFTIPSHSKKRFVYRFPETGSVRLGVGDLGGAGVALSKVVRIAA